MNNAFHLSGSSNLAEQPPSHFADTLASTAYLLDSQILKRDLLEKSGFRLAATLSPEFRPLAI